jgi:Putative beta barrel porin-7 (BBP7)
MPRRLALSLLIAWLAWIPMVSAQEPGLQGYPLPGNYGMAPGAPYTQGTGPYTDYRQVPTLNEQFHPGMPGWDEEYESRLDLGIAETFHRTWFRTDYLWLKYRDPDSRFIGATPLVIPPAVFDPGATFPAIDRVAGVRNFQNGELVSLENAAHRNNNGLRLTMGIPTQAFTWETSAFALGQSETNLQIDPYLDVNSIFLSTVYPAIPLTRNGQPSAIDYVLFDQGMNIKVRSNFQGTDTRFVFAALTPNVGLELAPLIGFNYLHYSNQLLIRGDDLGTATSHRIDSQANNNIFGPEIGFRLESRSKWMTLAVQPKFTFGINRMSNQVGTSQIFTSGFVIDPITGLPTTTPLEPDQSRKDTLTRFSPVLEFETSARFRLAENLDLSIGYQFMATTNMSLSEQNIVWDSSSILTDPPRIGLEHNQQIFWTQGIHVGLQWQF